VSKEQECRRGRGQGVRPRSRIKGVSYSLELIILQHTSTRTQPLTSIQPHLHHLSTPPLSTKAGQASTMVRLSSSFASLALLCLLAASLASLSFAGRDPGILERINAGMKESGVGLGATSVHLNVVRRELLQTSE